MDSHEAATWHTRSTIMNIVTRIARMQPAISDCPDAGLPTRLWNGLCRRLRCDVGRSNLGSGGMYEHARDPVGVGTVRVVRGVKDPAVAVLKLVGVALFYRTERLQWTLRGCELRRDVAGVAIFERRVEII